MSKIRDISGQKFGKLTALKIVGREKNRHLRWECICECGNHVDSSSTNLLHGTMFSCGCLKKEVKGALNKTHNMSKSREYKIWIGMKSRCYNKSNPEYYLYGERGIIICENWLNSFEKFYEDMGKYPISLSIDRINTNGIYSKENCRWADSFTQANNTRRNHYITYNNKTLTMSQWAREYNISIKALRSRLSSGWEWERALTQKCKN